MRIIKKLIANLIILCLIPFGIIVNSDEIIVSESSKSNLFTIESHVISGTIALPIGDISPPGGLNVTININASGEIFQNTVNIPMLSSSTSFTVSGNWGGEFTIYYTIDETPSYFSTGYHSLGGTVSSVENATVITDYTNTTYDLKILKKNTVAGFVKLPDGVTADPGMDVEVIAENNNEKIKGTFTFATGANNVYYTFYVPDGSYKMYYKLSPAWGFEIKGYFSSYGTTCNSLKAEYISSAAMYNVWLYIVEFDDHANSMETASEIAVNQTISGEIAKLGDEDFFKFVAPIKTMYTFELAGNYVDYTIYNSAGEEVLPEALYMSDINIVLEHGQTYYIRTSYNTTTSYSFIIIQGPQAVYQV